MIEHARESEPVRVEKSAPTTKVVPQRRAQRGRVVQRSWSVGSANDPLEREADAVAAEVMRLLDHPTSPSPTEFSSASTSRIARVAALSQAAPEIGPCGGELTSELASKIQASRGEPLDPATRTRFESAMGIDLGAVRIHRDSDVAPRIQATAFTVGSDIHFAPGRYSPETSAGRRLLAHELAHVIQQTPTRASAGGGGLASRTIRRVLSTTRTQLDAAFPTLTGVRGKVKGSRIPKIRSALERYHATNDGDPERLFILEVLVKYTSKWLEDHFVPGTDTTRAQIDLIASINGEAGVELSKIQAGAAFMRDAKAKVNAGNTTIAEQDPKARPLQFLLHTTAFENTKLYEQRLDLTNPGTLGRWARMERQEKVLAGELKPIKPADEEALTAGIKALSEAEFAAIHTYTGQDYEYINPQVHGRGKGEIDASRGRRAKAKNYETMWKYEEGGLHAGLIAEAFKKLPRWTGTTFRGFTMDNDYLGLTTQAWYVEKAFWSTSEAASVARAFMGNFATPTNTIAVLVEIDVTNGRDVARMSNVPAELEILLPPGSNYAIIGRVHLARPQDDKRIAANFGDKILTHSPNITGFYLVYMRQQSDVDVPAASDDTDWSAFL